MWRNDDTSYRVRSSSGTPSRRTNCVGTMCVLVTRYLSMRWSICCGRPLVHHHDGVPDVDRRTREHEHRGVVQRRADDVHVVVERLQPEQVQHPAERPAAGLGIDVLQRAAHALGSPRRARRVVHHQAHLAVRGHRGRLAGLQVLVRAEGVDLAADHDPALGGEADLVGRSLGVLGEARVRDEDLRFTVLHDVRDLGADEMPVDRDEVEARLADGEVELEHLGAVGQEHRDRVAGPEAHRPQPVHQLVARREQLAGGDLALVGVDEGQMLGVGLGDLPEPEGWGFGGRCGHGAGFSVVGAATCRGCGTRRRCR